MPNCHLSVLYCYTVYGRIQIVWSDERFLSIWQKKQALFLLEKFFFFFLILSILV